MNLSRMKAIWSFLLVVWLSYSMLTSSQKDACPPWFTLDNKTSTGCSCYRKEGRGVECHSNSALLKFGYSVYHCSLATAWLTTTQMDFVKLASVHTLLITLQIDFVSFSYQILCPNLMSSCVVLWIEKVHCVESPKMAIALHSIHTH